MEGKFQVASDKDWCTQ